jgi:Isopenicillin N synthase and related dioxygenases
MNESHNYMRISKYPPIINDQNKASGDGIGSHIDYGFLTILLQDKVEGLEIKDSDGQWFKAPIIPGTFLINIGHMIQRWTNDYYRATVHRVVSPQDKARLSVPFFFEPNYDTVIEPIGKFCTDSNPIKYSSLHFGDYLEKTFKTSYSNINI